jgi:hypothetical protein
MRIPSVNFYRCAEFIHAKRDADRGAAGPLSAWLRVPVIELCSPGLKEGALRAALAPPEAPDIDV